MSRDFKAAFLEKWHLQNILDNTNLILQYMQAMKLPDIRAAVEDLLDRIEAATEEVEGKYYKEEEEVVVTTARPAPEPSEKKVEEREFRPASESQINYIRRLQDKLGIEVLSEAELKSLSKEEAHKWIDKLIKELEKRRRRP